MSKFELIEKYLTNQLTESERMAFEEQITSDPSLKADLELQKNIIQGIKKARAVELKAMLNNVPVAVPTSFAVTGMKMAAGVIGAGILITSLYYYYRPESLKEVPNLSTSFQDSLQGADSIKGLEKRIPIIVEPAEENNQPINKLKVDKEKDTRKNEIVTPSTVNQPKLDVVDPTLELSSENSQDTNLLANTSNSGVASSNIQVETDSSNKKYNFHYQFSNGKLQLFGPFDNSLYEILEINGGTHSLFLFYRENYYLLDEKQDQITKLPLIKDSALLNKLKEYRNK
ncbi:MAG: hypothetical protein AABY93_17170 [Bacteroidota bacterium]